MRIQDIKIGTYYRFKDSPDYGYAKALEVLKPKQGENTHTYCIIKCEHTVYKNNKIGYIRYFKADALIKEKENKNGNKPC